MDNKIIITFIILGFFVILVSMILMKPNIREYMSSDSSDTSLTDIDIEALQNLSSMYNSSTQTLNVTNIAATGTATVNDLAVTGNATTTGTTTVNDLAVTGNATTSGTTTVNNLAVTGNATVSGTTKTTGGTFSEYYVINAKDTSMTELQEFGSMLSGTSPSATGIIYSSSKGKLGMKVGSHYYMTTLGSNNMIDFYDNTVNYYVGTGKSV